MTRAQRSALNKARFAAARARRTKATTTKKPRKQHLRRAHLAKNPERKPGQHLVRAQLVAMPKKRRGRKAAPAVSSLPRTPWSNGSPSKIVVVQAPAQHSVRGHLAANAGSKPGQHYVRAHRARNPKARARVVATSGLPRVPEAWLK
jgi:hypothetical protein